ncbi:MAG: ATP-binding protein, partial [Calditrichaeota bacterium]|nr:ATP-binding protein [Calditrichota bacterium]
VNGISTDSVFYHGASLFQLPQPEIEHKNNSLRFQFAALSYDDPSANLYQVKLYGFDADWSNWSNEKKKDYTSLPAGDYTFRVRAKNVYEHLSREGIFSFTILPPWYQTWWAFISYTFFAGIVMFAIVKSRVRHFENKTRELESIVAERTGVIREQAEKLLELNEMKSRFFANISHEFRTPLTLILGPLEERIARAKKKADKEEFSMMHRSGQRLLRLINELLDLSSLESGKMKLKASRGDFVTFLKGIVMSFASLAQQNKITLKREIPRHLESAEFSDIYFDPDKIEKIFSNLLSNAFKFTPEGGQVSVTVNSENRTSKIENEPRKIVEIQVIDTGIGIPADRLPHIFDRFYQVDGTSTKEQEGTGIGLALTKELVVLHHGSLNVESEEGHGTTFIVLLPVGKKHLNKEEIAADTSDIRASESSIQHQEPSIKNQESSIEHQESSIKNPGTSIQKPVSSSEDIILIVDDHPDVCNYIRKQLETNYQIIEAQDGQQGVDTAIKTIPDLVISDVMMPKLDGNQLCEALKTNVKTSHIPIILLTAKAGEEDKLAGLKTGADDYLTKPFSAKELQVRVRNLIAQRRKLRARFVREGILQPREVAVTSMDEEFLHRLMNEIEEQLAEEDFGVEQLSLKVNMSARQLHRKVHALTARSPVELIRTVRLQRARQLLEQKTGSISEIAYQVGFSNLSYFARMFKEAFGKLPSEI